MKIFTSNEAREWWCNPILVQVYQSLCYVTSLLSLLSFIQYVLALSPCCSLAPQKPEIFGNIHVNTILLIQ